MDEANIAAKKLYLSQQLDSRIQAQMNVAKAQYEMCYWKQKAMIEAAKEKGGVVEVPDFLSQVPDTARELASRNVNDLLPDIVNNDRKAQIGFLITKSHFGLILLILS
jgi:hypothetical protein